MATVVVLLLLQWFENLTILCLGSSEMKVKQVSFKKKHSFCSHCCRKTEALTPVDVKCLEMRNQVMNKPLSFEGGGGSTGATESLVLSNHELTAKISHLHFYKTCCQQQLPHSELTPQANENSFRAKTFTLTCYQWVPTQ